MSSRAREREEFLYRMAELGVPLSVARKLLRYGATLQRLAEAQCNGDWPADNGTKERPVVACLLCESLWVKSAITGGNAASEAYRLARLAKPLGASGRNALALAGRGIQYKACPDCRTSALVTLALAPYGLKAFFAGDPRGAVVSIVKASVKRDDFESGRERGTAVPA